MKRRIASLLLCVTQILVTLVAGEVFTQLPARAATFACNAGKDGSPGTLSGVYNTYYEPPAGTAAAGATSISLGTIDTTGGGASTAVTAGDELLIMQMQAGTLNSANSSSYGMTSAGSAGLYEYVQVASITGTTATIVGGGAGGGLINTYTEAAATSSSGQQTYQIVRVPQYATATLSSTFHAAYWDGQTGGIAALDIATTLNLGGASIYATGNGFRGAGFSVATTTPTSILNSDWVDSATMNGTPTSNSPGQGFKGEGILGTPAFTFGYTTFTTPSTPAGPAVNKAATDGYPGGDMARGAPANAGGGGTDADPSQNDENTGGGGGANGGAGGNGGYPWTPNEPEYPIDSPGQHTDTGFAAANTTTNNPDIGGRGGQALSSSVTRLYMGGGGGAGSNNNASNNNSYNEYGSSGGVGGGIVMMRIADTSGSPATIYANGTTGLAPDNDGGGGGGAGGSVEITSPNAFSGITVYANGAAGTSAYETTSDTSTTTEHGPGGGGGGGVVLTSSPVTSSVAGGANGTTVYGVYASYGSTSGASGASGTILSSQIPGAPSGAECSSSSASASGFIGPVDTTEATYYGANETGSYNGAATVGNDNDFTARSFVPSGANFTNSGTVPGTPAGNTLSGTATVSVPNEIYYKNASTTASATVTLTAIAPTTMAGWTVQLCPNNAGAPDCSGATTTPFAPSAAGSTTSVSFTVAKRTTLSNTIAWGVYAVPANTVAFTRYDGEVSISDSSSVNYTHDELYAGFIPITKTTTVQSTGCPAGETPPANGICPSGVLMYALDYRNIMLGAGLGTEGQNLPAFLATAAGQLTITDNGSAAGSNWATNTSGLKEALSAGVTGNTACGVTAGKCGDSTANTTFTGNTAGSTSFTATIGGTTFQLTPSGYTGGTSQGTVTFAVVIK